MDLGVNFYAKLLDLFLIKHTSFTAGSVFNILLEFKPSCHSYLDWMIYHDLPFKKYYLI